VTGVKSPTVLPRKKKYKQKKKEQKTRKSIKKNGVGIFGKGFDSNLVLDKMV